MAGQIEFVISGEEIPKKEMGYSIEFVISSPEIPKQKKITKEFVKNNFLSLIAQTDKYIYNYIEGKYKLCDCLVSEKDPDNLASLGLYFKGSSITKTPGTFEYYIHSDYRGSIVILLGFNKELTNIIAFNICYGNLMTGRSKTLRMFYDLSLFKTIYYNFLEKEFNYFRESCLISHPDLTIITMEDIITNKQLKKRDPHPLADEISKDFFVFKTKEDGRFECEIVEGNTRTDVLVNRIGNKERCISIQLKSTDSPNYLGKYALQSTLGYITMIIIGFIFDDEYHNCLAVKYWFGKRVKSNCLAISINGITFKEVFDFIDTQFKQFEVYGFHPELELTTMEEAELVLSKEALEERHNFDYLKSILTGLIFERKRFERRIYDFIIKSIDVNNNLLDLKIQQKSININYDRNGFVTILQKYAHGQHIRYALTDDIHYYIFISEKLTKDFVYILTTLEMYKNKGITLRDDLSVTCSAIYLYPPGTPSDGKKRNEWANVGYLNVNDPDLKNKVYLRLNQGFLERDEVKRLLAA